MTNRSLAHTPAALKAAFFVAVGSTVAAQMTPVGSWHSIDDKPGKLNSLIVINEADQSGVCKECTDDRQDARSVNRQLFALSLSMGISERIQGLRQA
ncbi:MAG: hypothetical protein IPN53_09470 [Comamonadaceae bacterium]|nr:hypothetical protein [Comamonadaceae bacterium]